MKEKTHNLDLLFSKIDDKIKFCNSKNKITYTDFLTMPEKIKIEKYLKSLHIQNYFFFGARENADREILIFYPQKLTKEMAQKNINNIISAIRITLPNSLKGTFEHKDYLSGIMKLGLVREKIGDILVQDYGADIIVLKEIAEYLNNNIILLTRFKKSTSEIINVTDINQRENKFEEFNIIINSMRIDNIVSEITHSSRNKTEELISAERVSLNYELIDKGSKIIKGKDIIVVKGYGKFIIGDFIRNTSSGKLIISIKKPI